MFRAQNVPFEQSTYRSKVTNEILANQKLSRTRSLIPCPYISLVFVEYTDQDTANLRDYGY